MTPPVNSGTLTSSASTAGQGITVPAAKTEPDSANASKRSASNDVKRVVEEMLALLGDIHESKQELFARGIPFHTVNVMVEMGAKGQVEQQAQMCKNALATSVQLHGTAAITAEQLDTHLNTLIALEKDLGHVRKLGRNQGLDMTSINFLTQFIRQNPGDGGEKRVNTFLGYAMACDIPLHRITEIAERAESGPESVLPDIPRTEEQDELKASRKRLITDVSIGCLLAMLALLLLT